MKGVKGVKSVQRIVCGGCLDFKVVTALDADSFGAWEESKFAPEEKFLAKIKAIDGVTQVDRSSTQEIRGKSASTRFGIFSFRICIEITTGCGGPLWRNSGWARKGETWKLRRM